MRTLTLALALLCGSASATDLNTASRAELEQLRGVGVALAQRLLVQREQRPFSDWDDVMRRVPGVRAATARRLSDAGLRVGGVAYAP